MNLYVFRNMWHPEEGQIMCGILTIEGKKDNCGISITEAYEALAQ